MSATKLPDGWVSVISAQAMAGDSYIYPVGLPLSDAFYRQPWHWGKLVASDFPSIRESRYIMIARRSEQPASEPTADSEAVALVRKLHDCVKMLERELAYESPHTIALLAEAEAFLKREAGK